MKEKLEKQRKAKKQSGKKGPPKRPRRPKAPPPLGLHGKKLLILKEVPIMPCSAFSRDQYGLRYAHTQAEKVYKIYREKCQEYGLTIRRIEGKTTNAERPKFIKTESDWEIKAVPCVRFEGVWEIRDNETGQTETFGGAGDGDNQIWSANSAQTIARKQALLDYFETAWPQPTDWCKLVRESLEEQGTNMVEALKMILPSQVYEILTATKAIKELTEFYGKEIPCPKTRKSRKKSK